MIDYKIIYNVFLGILAYKGFECINWLLFKRNKK